MRISENETKTNRASAADCLSEMEMLAAVLIVVITALSVLLPTFVLMRETHMLSASSAIDMGQGVLLITALALLAALVRSAWKFLRPTTSRANTQSKN